MLLNTMSYNPFQKKTLDETLKAAGRDAEEREAERKAEYLKLPYLDLRLRPIQTDALKTIEEKRSHLAKAAGIETKGHNLLVVAHDTEDTNTKALLEELQKTYTIKLFIVSLSSLEKAWDFYKLIPPPAEDITGSVAIEPKQLVEYLEQLRNIESLKKALEEFKDPLVSKILEVILAGALATDASDVHLEPEEDKVKFRLRIDGDLHDVSFFPHHIYVSILSRIKLLSELKINIRNVAQDGRFTIHAG